MPDANATVTESIAATLAAINRAWLLGRPGDLAPYFHPDLTMVFPGFDGRAEGRDALIAGFADFCASAKVLEYHEDGLTVDVAGDAAVASFRYTMVYERSAESYRAAGRDLWVFARKSDGDPWLAVWRTMLDVSEQPA